MTDESIYRLAERALSTHRDEARAALIEFDSYVRDDLPPVPGMPTIMRLAVRIEHGKASIAQAAAREYLYRWRLALDSHVFGVPHTIGM